MRTPEEMNRMLDWLDDRLNRRMDLVERRIDALAEDLYLADVKSFNINIRVSDDLREKVQYVKLLPGGITGFVEKKLREVEIDRELLKKLKDL
jgi:hypothetical protein